MLDEARLRRLTLRAAGLPARVWQRSPAGLARADQPQTPLRDDERQALLVPLRALTRALEHIAGAGDAVAKAE